VKRALLLAGLTVSLAACNLFPSSTPRVLDVDPMDGEENVGINTSVRATLSLPDGQIDLTTLTDATVTLTDASGTAVAVTRDIVDGDTLVVDPTTDLEPNMTYSFNVTTGLQTENGTALEPFSSSFTTGTGAIIDPSPDRYLTPLRDRVVFSAGGATTSDTRSLTLVNTGNETIDVSSLSISGPDAAQFSLADDSAFSLAPNAQRALELTFTPSGVGPQQATLSVQSSDSLSGTLEVPLGGLSVEGQGGNLEPSLQWIFDTYGLPIDSGDNDPGTTPLVEEATNELVGDEVAAQRFLKADAGTPVSVEVLAAFGVENDPVLEFGYYTAGSAASRQKLFDIQQTPTLNAQRLAPEVDGSVDAAGRVSFDPGSEAFGLYSYWPSNRFFDARTVYSEDRLNTFPDAIPHQVRAYPLKDETGAVVENAYVLATEEFTQGFDYNDVVVILRNVTPAAGGVGVDDLQITTPVGLPYSDRLVLQQIENTSGSLCDDVDPVDPTCNPEQWADIVFRNTGTVRLRNLGSSALQLGLSVADSNLFVLPNGETSLTLPPGDSYDLTVEFAPVGLNNKGVYPSALSIQAGEASTDFMLTGIYMRRPEGGREVYLGGVINEAFGYQTELGTTAQGGLTSSAPDSALVGEEVRAAYWQAANPGRPVVATQIAAFHSCCRVGDTFELWARGASSPFTGMRHQATDGQSLYPRLQGGSGVASLEANAGGAFEIRVADYSTDPGKGKGNGNLGVRLWPLRDAAGQLIANTYIVAQDFVENGCGSSDMANCDYNDNLYVVSNIAPAN
jgi:hypothetical protein